MPLQLLRNRAVMYVPAAANTYYPTGVNLGLSNRAGTVFGAAASRTTTAAQSVFLKEKPAADFNMQFVIRRIQIIELATAASTTDIQAHATTDMLFPQFTATAVTGYLIGRDAIELCTIFHGGFKVVQAGGASGVLLIEFEYELG